MAAGRKVESAPGQAFDVGDGPCVRRVRQTLAAGPVLIPPIALPEQSSATNDGLRWSLLDRVRTPWHNGPPVPVHLASSALMRCLEATEDIDGIERSSEPDTALASALTDFAGEAWQGEEAFRTSCSPHFQEWTNATMCLEPANYEEALPAFLTDPVVQWKDTQNMLPRAPWATWNYSMSRCLNQGVLLENPVASPLLQVQRPTQVMNVYCRRRGYSTI